jgi:ASPIC and UnbV/FG-GAP-like repeat/Glycosyl hydrolase catalytic core
MFRSRQKLFLIVLLITAWVSPANSLELGMSVNHIASEHFYQAHLDSFKYVDQLIEEMKKTNINSIRMGFYCDRYVDQDSIQILELELDNVEEVVTRFANNEIEVIFILSYGSKNNPQDILGITGCSDPSYPVGDYRWKYSPPTEVVWRDYVQGMMENFGDKISGIEVWNEPNHFNLLFHARVEDYISLFNIAAEEVNALYPNLPIATGGLTFQRAPFKSFMAALLDTVSGVYNQCDAFGLHMYNEHSLEELQLYHQVCSEVGVQPKPIWVTEFGRKVDEDPDPNKFRSWAGVRAYMSQNIELFSTYGVERACYFTISDYSDEFNLFEWDENQEHLEPTYLWEYYAYAAEKYHGFEIGESVGFGNFGGVDLIGITPFEEFQEAEFEDSVHWVNQSYFDFVSNVVSQNSVRSKNEGGTYAPISFDINDTWVNNYPYEKSHLEVDILCTGSAVELRYQSCCEEEFRTTQTDTSHLNALPCQEFLSGLTIEFTVPDYQHGVDYLENTNVDTLTITPNTLTTVTLELSDFMFQNGMDKRSDISFVPVNNQEFEIHRIEIRNAVWSTEYTDKSAETQLQYSGQPLNAMSLNYNNDDFKDLFITLDDEDALANKCTHYGAYGAPFLIPRTNTVLPSGSRPESGANGIISADFDNDGWIDFFATHPYEEGRLFRNINGEYYSDWTVESGLTLGGDLTNAFSASWADYNGDGFLDLTVISGSLDLGYGDLVVFHNNGGTFEESGIEFDSVGNSPLWADFDNDGDLDLIVLASGMAIGGVPLGYPDSYFFINQGDDTMVIGDWARLGSPIYGSGGTIATVFDFDNDGDLDVVYAETDGLLSVLVNDAPANPGLGYFSREPILPYGIISVNRPTDIAVLDYNLDGNQDVIVSYDNWNSPTEVLLFGNRTANGVLQFSDETDLVGLSGTGLSAGMAVADYNLDGFSDIYLTRASNQEFFFKGQPASGGSQNNWVGVRLSSPYGANNTNGIGARIEVTAGQTTFTQIIDGGSGLASQHESDLVFGLGNYVGSVEVKITWPNGRIQYQSNLVTRQYHTVIDDSPVIEEDSVNFLTVYHLDPERVDWVFSWVTKNNSDTGLDKVRFDLSGVPQSCPPGMGVLHEQLGGVTVTIDHLGGDRYQHTLTLINVDCELKCTIPYTVESAVDDFTSISSTRLIKIKFCLVTP